MIILFNIKIDIKIRFIFFIEMVFYVIFYVTYRIRLSAVWFGAGLATFGLNLNLHQGFGVTLD